MEGRLVAANTRSRPFIGINADFTTIAKSGVSFARLPIGYVDSIASAGGVPMILPPLTKDMELEPILDRLDGIVLSGGLDLDPRRAGQPTHRSVIPMPERREASDRRLVEAIVDRQIPLLAIGVGMQHLNMVCGGTLFLHLPEEMPKSLPHFDPTGTAHRHMVVVEPNTRLDEIYGGGELRVNSAHHQAIKTVAPKMRSQRHVAGRDHRSHRSRRARLVLHRRAVASRSGNRLGARSTTFRMFRASDRAAIAAAANRGVNLANPECKLRRVAIDYPRAYTRGSQHLFAAQFRDVPHHAADGNHPHRGAVHHDRQVPIAAHIHFVQSQHERVVCPDRLGIRRHEVGHRPRARFSVGDGDALEQIPLAEDARELARVIENEHRADFVFHHRGDGLRQRHILTHGNRRRRIEIADDPLHEIGLHAVLRLRLIKRRKIEETPGTLLVAGNVVTTTSGTNHVKSVISNRLSVNSADIVGNSPCMACFGSTDY